MRLLFSPGRVLAALVVVGCLLGGSVGQACADAPPVVGLPDISIRDNVTRTVLDNGLTLLVVEDQATDIVGMVTLFRVGQVHEDDSTAGITHLVQNILIRRMNKTPESKANFFESKGSLLRANATPDYAEISLMTDGRNFPSLLTTITRAVAQRHFSEDEVNAERRKLVELLDADQRVFRAIYEIFLQWFYRYHPYRQPQEGHSASVRQLTKGRIESFYARYWAPNKTVIAVVGNVDRNEVLKLVKKAMGNLPQVEDKRLEIAWEPRAVEKELELASGSNLAWIFLGYPAPGMKSPDYVPMKILATILGDGLSSRLWVELREKRGLAYELGTIYPELEGPSHMIDYMVTTPQQLGESQSRIFKEVERIRSMPVSPAELEAAKRRLIGQYLLERETTQGQAFNLALEELLGSGYQADLQTIDRIRKVTEQDVLRVARFYLKDHTLVVARPRDTFPFFR